MLGLVEHHQLEAVFNKVQSERYNMFIKYLKFDSVRGIKKSIKNKRYKVCFQGDASTLMRSQRRPMWVFKKELMDQYQSKNNAPYGSTLHRIERYIFTAHDPDATVTAYRVLHTRPKM